MAKTPPRFYLDEIRRATIAAKENGCEVQIEAGKIRIVPVVDSGENPKIESDTAPEIELL